MAKKPTKKKSKVKVSKNPGNNSLLFNLTEEDIKSIEDLGFLEELEQFAYGTTIEDPSQALYENEIAMLKAQMAAANNPLTNVLDILGNTAIQVGSSMMTSGKTGTTPGGEEASSTGFAGWLNRLGGMEKKALGGAVGTRNVEVEGGELAELPDGMILDFEGPSHENDGIPINLPIGSEVYSKRILVKGETMAKRKEARAKIEERLNKLLEQNSSDVLAKNTFDRTTATMKAEENHDLAIQDFVSKNFKTPGETEKLAYGTGGEYIPPDWLKDLVRYRTMLDHYDVQPQDPHSASLSGGTPSMGGNVLTDEVVIKEGPPSLIEKPLPTSQNTPTTNDTDDKEGFNWSSLFKNMATPTLGDAVGMYGNWKQAQDILKTIQENRAGDTPNINAFENYGKEGLETLQGAKGYAAQIRDELIQKLNLSRNTSAARNRNSARGVNTMRALDIAGDSILQEGTSDAYSNFANTMLNLISQEAQMENQQDQMVMQGEQARDLADRQDRDNYFTQLITGQKNVNRVTSELGKNLNQIQDRQVNENLINNLSNYVQVNFKNGQITAKEGLDLLGAGDGAAVVRRFEKNKEYANLGYSDADWEALTQEEKNEVVLTKKRKV